MPRIRSIGDRLSSQGANDLASAMAAVSLCHEYEVCVRYVGGSRSAGQENDASLRESEGETCSTRILIENQELKIVQ